ncbi:MULTISPECIES: ABC transporter ATP-binding protein [Jeotgalicoccus]|uniref:ABC transporter ATP-binding protein n=1 Tax=Jeotgalicoccus nanhaiensis TaxID=568603 RepID=A0ABR9XUL4_9STAP|nr:ABC transporter ATP-binding protein [Jeotgalicoccus nanhaiensis]MBF0752635.1 ABC transporter ATP-binding protein [Jeotgalicoccus nanhaiensis]TFU62809.1 ABC transporter ATP-binding protein [Jeotgalicoccus nanhaiensis]
MMYKVKVENVSKIYDINRNRIAKVLSLLTFGKLYKAKPFYALRDIDFEVNAGDSVGILGLNGSGKTTLSDLIAEATVPSKGKIHINGRTSLIAISAGLNQELTGEENIRIKCLMHGLSEKQIADRYDDILKFSELGEFIKQPIKNYSSGMKSRLGFAIAIHTDPDILIVDEALSVGDETFANKCIDRMRDFQEQGKTIFFVSHATGQIRQFCNKAVWVQYGEMKQFGEMKDVVKSYAEFVNQYKNLTKDEQIEYKDKMVGEQMKASQHLDLPKEKINMNSVAIGTLLFLFMMFGIVFQIFSL